jgi:hypothetical protein
MTRDEMISLFERWFTSVNEGETSLYEQGELPRLVYWDYMWNFLPASGKAYAIASTYQVSIFSDVPPRENHKLKRMLNELTGTLGYAVDVMHEYNPEDRVWHSAFTITTSPEEPEL